MILDILSNAYSNGETNIVLTADDYATLLDEVASSESLDEYEISEIHSYRYKGSLAIGVDYTEQASIEERQSQE